ncbi:casein kinase II, regulatory subunit [Blastocladiella britannica]|nr:casein kinase II, regulatory subunit [Blastocladiella britannica]
MSSIVSAMETSDLSTSSSAAAYWVDEFLLRKGNELFCNVDEEYILDKFNLTGISSEVEWYNQAMEIVLDTADLADYEEPIRPRLQHNCIHLYGLIHARYVITARGLQKMADKFRRAEFGTCARVACRNMPVLPVGLSDLPGVATVKLYCPRCMDVYHPRLPRHAVHDGAYWGTTFPHLLLQTYPTLVEQIDPHATAVAAAPVAGHLGTDDLVGDREGHFAPAPDPFAADRDRYTPKIFGFKIHALAQVQRQRNAVRSALEAQKRANSAATTPVAAPASSETVTPMDVSASPPRTVV